MIDDHKVNNFINQKLLEKHFEELEVLSFEEPYDALDYLDDDANQVPDLIFLDINMPDMDGWEFIEKLQVNERLARIPIVMLSSSIFKSDLEKSKSYPTVIDFQMKPLTKEYVLNLKSL